MFPFQDNNIYLRMNSIINFIQKDLFRQMRFVTMFENQKLRAPKYFFIRRTKITGRCKYFGETLFGDENSIWRQNSKLLCFGNSKYTVHSFQINWMSKNSIDSARYDCVNFCLSRLKKIEYFIGVPSDVMCVRDQHKFVQYIKTISFFSLFCSVFCVYIKM